MSAKKYFFTPDMDQRIRELYQDEVGMKAVKYSGPMKALAKEIGIPRWRVSKRAVELGVLPFKKKEPNWCPKELEILEHLSYRTAPTVQKYLKKAGYRRSLQAVVLQRKRKRYTRRSMDPYTATELAECFGIDVHAIVRWVHRGWLKAMRRGTARTRRQGGDEWLFRDQWIRNFILNYVDVIDFRKADKYWMVDMLVGPNGRGMNNDE